MVIQEIATFEARDSHRDIELVFGCIDIIQHAPIGMDRGEVDPFLNNNHRLLQFKNMQGDLQTPILQFNQGLDQQMNYCKYITYILGERERKREGSADSLANHIVTLFT